MPTYKPKSRHTEPQINGELARLLRSKNPLWNDDTVRVEQTAILRETGRQPDIIINTPYHIPVSVETECSPAYSVEKDAIDRLGKKLADTGEEIESAISVILPDRLRYEPVEMLSEARLAFVVHTMSPEDNVVRWPATGSIEGNIDDLANAIEYLSMSERRLAQGTAVLEQVVQEAAGLLEEHAGSYTLGQLGDKLYQESGYQTNRMVSAILTSAYVFHTAIEKQEFIPSVLMPNEANKEQLLTAWNQILDVNYYPIFKIATDLLGILPISAASKVMNRIAQSISKLATLGATTYHDLCGRMFQTLISDRKFLATFYTLPSSACLLAEKAIERMKVDWSDSESIKKLKIGDFSCGTGALLSAAQRAVYKRHRRSGGNDALLHRFMLENVLTGLDIMPAATHLTCSMLSSAHPALPYYESQVLTMPYGKREDEGGGVSIGSLDFLKTDRAGYLFGRGIEVVQKDDSKGKYFDLPDNSFDLVIMNPPFTRPTGQEADKEGVPVPSFAGFNTSNEEQRQMSNELKKCISFAGDGKAGLASNFIDLAHNKLKGGGGDCFCLTIHIHSRRSME